MLKTQSFKPVKNLHADFWPIKNPLRIHKQRYINSQTLISACKNQFDQTQCS